MGAKFKTIVFGTLVAGSLALSAGQVMARDWDWPHRDYRYRDSRDYRDYRYRDSRGYAWSRREGLYRQLDSARSKLAYDRAHHASREQLAHDTRRIEDLWREINLSR
jgi:hypothetical protein